MARRFADFVELREALLDPALVPDPLARRVVAGLAFPKKTGMLASKTDPGALFVALFGQAAVGCFVTQSFVALVASFCAAAPVVLSDCTSHLQNAGTNKERKKVLINWLKVVVRWVSKGALSAFLHDDGSDSKLVDQTLTKAFMSGSEAVGMRWTKPVGCGGR